MAGLFQKPGVTALAAIFFFVLHSCTKTVDEPPGPDVPFKLSYGDSVLYLKNQAADFIVNPQVHKPGTYIGFPEGIQIDDLTGAINVSQSESGLRYKITHISPEGDSTSATVVISGINYPDKIYSLSAGDSVVNPVYNANPSHALPVAGSVFDEGGGANGSGCSIATANGKLNLAETLRSGLLGTPPRNDERRDVDIFYRLNDASGKALNKIRVRLYFYNNAASVAPDIVQILQDRDTEGVFLRQGLSTPTTSLITARTTRLAKPRPPCVIVVP